MFSTLSYCSFAVSVVLSFYKNRVPLANALFLVSVCSVPRDFRCASLLKFRHNVLLSMLNIEKVFERSILSSDYVVISLILQTCS